MTAEIDVINESWTVDSQSRNGADSVGLMVYEGTLALQYVKNFAHGAAGGVGEPHEDGLALACGGLPGNRFTFLPWASFGSGHEICQFRYARVGIIGIRENNVILWSDIDRQWLRIAAGIHAHAAICGGADLGPDSGWRHSLIHCDFRHIRTGDQHAS